MSKIVPTTGWSLPVPRLRRGHWRLTPNVREMKMIKYCVAIYVAVLLSGCSTARPLLSLSGDARWTDPDKPKAKMQVAVQARLNGRSTQVVEDIVELDFPFTSAKIAMDPPDWHQEGEIVGWWYVTPDDPVETSAITVKAVIERPPYLAGWTDEKVFIIRDEWVPNHGLESTSAPPAAGTLETHP